MLSIHTHIYTHTHTHNPGQDRGALHPDGCRNWLHRSECCAWRGGTVWCKTSCKHQPRAARKLQVQRRIHWAENVQVSVGAFSCGFWRSMCMCVLVYVSARTCKCVCVCCVCVCVHVSWPETCRKHLNVRLWTQTCRVGQNRIYTPYMTVYLVIFLPNIPNIHRIYIWFWPTFKLDHPPQFGSRLDQSLICFNVRLVQEGVER